MSLTADQIAGLMQAHQCELLTWPHGAIARFSARHAAAMLGADLVAARARIEALEAAIRSHKQAHAGPEYMACFDVNADLWGMVSNE